PEDTLLLDYWNSSRGSAVIAVSRRRAGLFPIVVDEAPIRSFIQALAAGRSAGWRVQSAAIGARLLPPADWLSGVSRIVVVPDGLLSLVPVEVVAQGNQLIVERAAGPPPPTAATLFRSAPAPRWLPPWRLQIRAFADPVTGSNGLDGSAGGRLPASAQE